MPHPATLANQPPRFTPDAQSCTRRTAFGAPLSLRPVRPADAPLLAALVNGLPAAARRNRFHGAVQLSAQRLAQMCQVDPQQQLALVVSTQADGSTCLVADARCCIAGDGLSADFALMVDARWQRHGLGGWALQALLAACSQAGLQWLRGDVLDHNLPMLALAQRCGFATSPDPDDARLLRVQRRLTSAPQPVAGWQAPWRSAAAVAAAGAGLGWLTRAVNSWPTRRAAVGQ